MLCCALLCCAVCAAPCHPVQGAAITNPLQIPHAACLLQGPGLQLPDAVAVPLSAGTAGILLSFVLSPAEMVKVGAGVGGLESHLAPPAATAWCNALRTRSPAVLGKLLASQLTRAPCCLSTLPSPCPSSSAACSWAALSATTATAAPSTACGRRFVQRAGGG